MTIEEQIAAMVALPFIESVTVSGEKAPSASGGVRYGAKVTFLPAAQTYSAVRGYGASAGEALTEARDKIAELFISRVTAMSEDVVALNQVVASLYAMPEVRASLAPVPPVVMDPGEAG